MSSVLIHHHPGLGDHFMCHGIVREYAKRYTRVGLFALPHNYASVAFMYRDLPHLTVYKATEAEAKERIAGNAREGGLGYDEVKIIGFEHLDRTSGVPLQRQLYRIAEVDFSKTWDNFYVARDRAREQALFEKAAPKSDYVFLHEDAPRNYRIERKLIDKKFKSRNCAFHTFLSFPRRRESSNKPFSKDLDSRLHGNDTNCVCPKIVEPNEKLTDNIFDYCTIIERAKEIHVIDSSFMFLIDCLAYDTSEQKLFVHRYARENETWKLPLLKKNWTILTLGGAAAEATPLSKFLDRLEVFLLTHPLSKRPARKLYRSFGWRTRSQKRGN